MGGESLSLRPPGLANIKSSGFSRCLSAGSGHEGTPRAAAGLRLPGRSLWHRGLTRCDHLSYEVINCPLWLVVSCPDCTIDRQQQVDIARLHTSAEKLAQPLRMLLS